MELRSIIAAHTIAVLEKRGTLRGGGGFNRCFSGGLSRKVVRVGTMAEIYDAVYLLSRPLVLMFVLFFASHLTASARTSLLFLLPELGQLWRMRDPCQPRLFSNSIDKSPYLRSIGNWVALPNSARESSF